MTARRSLHRQHLTAPTGLRGGNRRLQRIASAVFGLTVMLALASLVTANNLATSGQNSVDLEQQIATLTTANSKLTVENSTLTSMSRIYQEALAQGFVTAKKVEAIRLTPPVAFKDH